MGKGAKSKSGREKASGRAAMKASEGDDMEEGNFDDSESVASTTASGSAAEARGGGRGVDEYDMSDIVEKLGEKRYTQREAGWSLLIRYMQANKDENFAELGSADYLETVSAVCIDVDFHYILPKMYHLAISSRHQIFPMCPTEETDFYLY